MYIYAYHITTTANHSETSITRMTLTWLNLEESLNKLPEIMPKFWHQRKHLLRTYDSKD